MATARAEVEMRLRDRITRAHKKVTRTLGTNNKKITKSIKTVEKQSEKTNRSLKENWNSTRLLLTGFAAFMAGKFTQSFVRAQQSIDKINNTLTVAAGGAEEAAKEYAFLEEETARLGLSIENSAVSYAQFIAAAKTSGLESEQLQKIFTGVSEAAAAMGLTADDAEGAMRALTQMMSKGNVQAEELRGQLGERIPGAFGMAAKAMGVTEKELNKMLEQGQVLAADLLPKLAQEMSNTFGAQAQKGPETMNGKINTLKNAMFNFKREILEGGGADLLKQFFEGATIAAEKLTGIMGKFFKSQKDINEAAKFYRDDQEELAKVIMLITRLQAVYNKEVETGQEIMEKGAVKEALFKQIEGIRGVKSEYQDLLKILPELQERLHRLQNPTKPLPELVPGLTPQFKEQLDAALDAVDKEYEERLSKIAHHLENEKLLESSLKEKIMAEKEAITAERQKDINDLEIQFKKQLYETLLFEDANYHVRQKEIYQKTLEEQKRINYLMTQDYDSHVKIRNKIREEEMKNRRQGLNDFVNNLNQAAQQFKIFGEAFKAAAISETIINTYAAAQAAYKSMAGIPYVGPVLGAGAAAAAVVAGLARVAQIKSQKFAQGGIVPGNSTTGDNVPARVNSGEMILNRSQQSRLFAMANGQGGGQQITFSAPVINIQNGDPDVVRGAVSETYQEMLFKFSLMQRDAQLTEAVA